MLSRTTARAAGREPSRSRMRVLWCRTNRGGKDAGDAPRTETDMFFTDPLGRQLKGWTNKLIWGDNKLILSSLTNGLMRDNIEGQGALSAYTTMLLSMWRRIPSWQTDTCIQPGQGSAEFH
jgi:hypothetical protein